MIEAEGAGFASVVSETVFLRNLRACVESVREARHRVLADQGGDDSPARYHRNRAAPAERMRLPEVSMHAVLPNRRRLGDDSRPDPVCGCTDCARAHGLRIHVGDEVRFHAAALGGPAKMPTNRRSVCSTLPKCCYAGPEWNFVTWPAPGSTCATSTATTRT